MEKAGKRKERQINSFTHFSILLESVKNDKSLIQKKSHFNCLVCKFFFVK